MHQSAPVTSESAPTITCAVATSAALFDQMVARAERDLHNNQRQPEKASFASGSFPPSRFRASQAHAATSMKIASATMR